MTDSAASSQLPHLKLHGKTKLVGHMVRPEQDNPEAAGSDLRAEAFQGEPMYVLFDQIVHICQIPARSGHKDLC